MAPKRSLGESASAPKAKKHKPHTENNKPAPSTSNLLVSEIDFPRGGGTSFTPLEVKNIRAEAIKEADDELFEDSTKTSKRQKKRRNSEPAVSTTLKNDKIRIEHLNYKRLTPGMKIFGQITAVHPLALIVSLPNQLFGHVPIINISPQLTQRLENMQEEEETGEEEEEEDLSAVPELSDLFKPGQYVRAVVTVVHASGTTDALGLSKSKDDATRMSRRIELSLSPDKVNDGVLAADLRPGFTITGSVQSVEDHGYTIFIGVPDVSGFLPFKGTNPSEKLQIGDLLDLTVSSLSGNGRICTFTLDHGVYASACLTEAVNACSVLPGVMVQCLLTGVHSDGLNLQILGFFDGTIDQLQLRYGSSQKAYKVGKKLKARILYNYHSTPPRFALSLAEHVMSLSPRRSRAEKSSPTIQEDYPIGTILEQTKVISVESERGLILETLNEQQGFVHISHVSDEHIISLSDTSGPWKLGSMHRARVTGYFAFDGILQLSLKKSILEQKFIQVTDVQVGELLRGTVKHLSEKGLFVSLSGHVDGFVRPHHYADIPLKHPIKRFKPGGSVKVRVLAVDPVRKLITLTAKKTLLESSLPIISSFEEAKVGAITHAVVTKVSDKHLIVEFFNNVKAYIPAKEAAESIPSSLTDIFSVGRVAQVRIISIDPELKRLVASIRQGSSNFPVGIVDISPLDVGNTVQGIVTEIHKDNAVLSLKSSSAKALISLKNLANYRGISVPQLLKELKVDEKLEGLMVVSKNTAKSLVIVAHKPKPKPPAPGKGHLSIGSVAIGQIVGGRVTRQSHGSAFLKLGSHVGGLLHPTDATDDYDSGAPFPPIDTLLKAAVVDIDVDNKRLTLSTRHSRMNPENPKRIVDREVNNISDLNEGESIRGFIKRITDHGLFVTLGRNIDARVQIRELFDEYVKDWKPRFEVNQVVEGYIIKIDTEKKQVEMSFRSPEVRHKSSLSSLSDLHEGMRVEGTVKRIEDYGLFVQLAGSKVTGLCHKSELADNEDADVAEALGHFHLGDRVKALILSIDQKRLSLSLKPSYFALDGDNNNDDRMELDVQAEGQEPSEDEETLLDASGLLHSQDEDSESDEEMEVDLGTANTVLASPSTKQHESSESPQAVLQLPSGFKWFEADEEADESSSSDESELDSDHGDASAGKKKKRRKQIEQDLTADIQTKVPDSNADFERVLLGSPNSSFLWIKYMSFQLQLSEVEKAREVAKRALKTISFREEQEKLNVWIALLNLESVYGTDESLDSTFKDAARHNDSKTVHLRMASIFDQAGRHDKAEELYKRTCKKFGQSSKVWTLAGEYYLRRGDLEQARQLLPRSLQSLEKRKHLKTISKFAQLEYKLGEPERGRTIFEGIVDSHSKRWDIWFVYMDMEAGQGDIQHLRNLFDRVLALRMSSHKAKSFFKKWLQLEQKLGEAEGEENVKRKAVEWTQRAAALA